MKKVFNKNSLQKIIFIGIIALVFGVFMLSLTLGSSEKNENKEPSKDETSEPDGSNNEGNKENPDEGKTPEEEKFKSPCFETDTYTIVRHFYELEDDLETQQMSLIQFENKFYTSKGVSYTLDGETKFDVYAAMSGTVLEVSESNVYGITVVIDHGDGIETEYVGLSEVTVEKGHLVSQGDVLGVSGSNEFDKDALNHVHFKVSINDNYYNPITVMGKTLEEMKNMVNE